MYEPKYQPQLNDRVLSLPGMGFAIVPFRKFIHPDDPEQDPMHVHPYLEIFLNISSEVSFLINGNLYSVPPGDAVISRPGEIHMGIFHTPAVQEYLCLWLDGDLSSPLFSFLHREHFAPLFSFDLNAKEKLQQLARSLICACENNSSELEKLSLLLQIMSVFEQKMPILVGTVDIPYQLQKILDDIHDNFAEFQSVNDILRTHFVSSATLTRWFRKHLHTSPREYLESVKLSNASVLLKNGHSVTEACVRSGFSDCSHFIARFKKKFGETPLRYKKEPKLYPLYEK